MGQGYDTRTLLVADRSLIVFALLLILLLGGIQCPKFLAPVGLKRIRYQSVRRAALAWQKRNFKRPHFLATPALSGGANLRSRSFEGNTKYDLISTRTHAQCS
jgi:hypothetical protein